MTALRLETTACRVSLAFVVSGRHPHFAAGFHAHLRGSEDVPGRVQRNAYAIQHDGLAIRERGNVRSAAKPMRHQRHGVGAAQIRSRPWAQMVTMRMRDHRSRDRFPWIDVKPAGRAIQPGIRRLD